MKKVMVVFGTRPEAIKMCPLVKELKSRDAIQTIVCVTGQHREMLDQVLKAFDVIPDFDLDVMKKNQSLDTITITIMEKIKRIIEGEKPDVILVHGDTTTAFATALQAFYSNVTVGHVEAGLRTYNNFSPYPEEFNRQAIDSLSSVFFAPTEDAKQNLLNEKKNKQTIIVTGNTGIDALRTTVSKEFTNQLITWVGESKLILLTAHRRENLGKPMENIFRAVIKLVSEYTDIKVVYPVHLNPKVQEIANAILANNEQIRLVEPLDVIEFHNIMDKSYIILTDSGGIQEEAPSLGKPVLVLRDTTERPEGIAAGTLKLVGTDTESIYKACKLLIDNGAVYKKMSTASNPYGDGNASKRIVEYLIKTM